MIEISQVLVYYFFTPLNTTPFSGVLTETHLESGRTSTMEFFFVAIMNSFKVLFSKKCSSTGLKIGF